MDEEYVFRAYNLSVNAVFSKYNNIQDALSSSHAQYPKIIWATEDGIVKYYNEQKMQSMPTPYFKISSKTIQEFKTQNPLKKISDDITVKTMYVMYGAIHHEGDAIYYETDKGNYVYYVGHGFGELLMPMKDFCELQKATRKKLRKEK